jgi:hypothetical protein
MIKISSANQKFERTADIENDIKLARAAPRPRK